MDMYQKRKKRQEMKNSENKEETQNQMNINWYPGHMAKTKKQIIQDLKLIDIVMEIVDARIPVASHNPDLGEIIKNKKRIIILNKSDLADENESKKWIEYYKNMGIVALTADCNQGKGINESINKIKELMKEDIQKDMEKGKVGRKIRVLVLGIPNVGKSSYINRATKRVTAKVGNKPGVTKQKQWIRLENNIELLDTPGVLWPKFEDKEIALNLAYTGTIKDDILDKVDLAYYLLKNLIENYPKNVKIRFKLEEFIETTEKNEDFILEQMKTIGKKRGAIVSGGRVDLEKTANIILDDFRTGKLGRITLEKVR